LEIRAGYQIFSWRVMESYSPADFLNQTYMEKDLLDPEKIGEPALRMQYFLNAEKNHAVELYYLPLFTPCIFPENGNRYDFFISIRDYEISASPESHVYQSPSREWRPQGAARLYSSLFENFDLSLFYFNGYERIPGFINTESAYYLHEYRLIDAGGATFRLRRNKWCLAGEGVYNKYQKEIQMRDIFSARNRTVDIDPYLTYAVGLKYRLIGESEDKSNGSLILEAMGDTDKERNPEDFDRFNPFTNHVFAGFSYKKGAVRSFSAGMFFDYMQWDVIYQLEFMEMWYKHLALKAKFNGLRAGNKSPLPEKRFASQLKPLEHTMRLSSEVIFVF
jgi:hypothetical protein